MSMYVKSSDVYLNTLCLAAYAPGPDTKRLMQAVVKLFEDVSKDDKIVVTPLNVFYVNVLKGILAGDIDISNKSELASMLMKFKDEPAIQMNKGLLEDLTVLLGQQGTVTARRIAQLWSNVKTHVLWTKSNRGLRRLLSISNKAASSDDVTREQIVQSLIDEMKSVGKEVGDVSEFEDESGIPVDEIDFSDPDSLKKAMAANHKRRDCAQLEFGLQGLNLMFGPTKMVPYGHLHAIAARSHHFKSNILMNITRWICTLNTPPDTGNKVPLALFVSLENEVHENLTYWFKTTYANVYQAEPENMTDDEIVEFVMREFSKKGFKLVVIRRMGETFGYHELEDFIDRLEKDTNGKVCTLGIDYAPLMKRCPEDAQFNDAKQLQKLFERLHNLTAHRDIFGYTGLQLETEAFKLAASGIINIVKKYNEAHLADCRGIKREVDGLWFQELETNHLGLVYLTTLFDKQRYINGLPKEDKYCAHRLSKFGLIDDLGKAPTYVRDIYAETVSDGVPASDKLIPSAANLF